MEDLNQEISELRRQLAHAEMAANVEAKLADEMKAERDAAKRELQEAQTLEWIDARECKHTMSREVAIKTLKEFYDEWPGGLEEIEASIRTWRRKAEGAG